jgi:hypothetical protein
MLLLKFCAKCHLDSTNLIFLAICSVCAGGEGRIQNPTLSSGCHFASDVVRRSTEGRILVIKAIEHRLSGEHNGEDAASCRHVDHGA